MHKNINSIISYMYDIPLLDPKLLFSWMRLTKKNVVANYVTVVELCCCAVGGINSVSA